MLFMSNVLMAQQEHLYKVNGEGPGTHYWPNVNSYSLWLCSQKGKYQTEECMQNQFFEHSLGHYQNI